MRFSLRAKRIIAALSERDTMCLIDITKKLDIKITPSTDSSYRRTLINLEKHGYIFTPMRRGMIFGRKYYSLTPKGSDKKKQIQREVMDILKKWQFVEAPEISECETK